MLSLCKNPSIKNIKVIISHTLRKTISPLFFQNKCITLETGWQDRLKKKTSYLSMAFLLLEENGSGGSIKTECQ